MVDPLSITASIVAIIQISSDIVKYVNGATGATKQRKRLREEVRACESLLQRLNDEISDAEEGDTWSETVKALDGPGTPLGRLHEALAIVKAKLGPKKGLKNAFTSLKWPFDGMEIEMVISAIEREKSLLNLAMANDSRKLVQEIKKSSKENTRQLAELINTIRESCLQNQSHFDELKNGLKQIHDSHSELQDNLNCLRDHGENREAIQQRQSILDWLTPIDYAPEQNDFIHRRQAGTGQWLLDSEQYQSWLQTSKQTFFGPGIPGVGKTIISSIVIDDLNTRFRNDQNIGVAYLYCDFRRQAEQDAQGLLENLLKQLSMGYSTVPDSLDHLHKKHKNQRTRPALAEVSKALCDVVTMYSRVFIVVDALDECQVTDGCRAKFLSEIFNLQYTCGANFFATSRLIPEIIEAFKGSISLEIQASDEDVRRYLGERVSASGSEILKSYHEEIITAIAKVVDGIFLLARLHFESVRTKRTLRKIRAALETLPTGPKAYDRAYDEAMKRITCQDADSKELAIKVISWITCARRRLTKLEIQHAFAVEVGDRELDEENLPQLKDMVSVCAGLVTIDEESNVIRLVHYTMQEYFKRVQDKWFPSVEVSMAKVCVTYLSFDVFESGFCHTDKDLENRLHLNPFYDYAARHWGQHARVASEEELTKLILSFLNSTAKISASSQASLAATNIAGYSQDVYSQDVPRKIAALHLAAYFGLLKVVMTLLSHGHDPNVTNSWYETPLLLAATNGCNAVVSLLVSGKNVDIDRNDDRGRTPVSKAAANGHKAVLRILLEKGAKLEPECHLGLTPLMYAASSGWEGVVKLLLEKGAQLEFRNHYDGMTALSLAAADGHAAVVTLLLMGGADLDSLDDRYMTPLAHAAAKGYATVVKLLLEKGAQLEFRNHYDGKTPLSVAADAGHATIVQLLLKNDAELESKNRWGQTPLWHAAKRGHTAVVKILLEHGAELEYKDVWGQTPLWHAAVAGHKAVVEMLLEKGAKPESKDTYIGTPLHRASACKGWGVCRPCTLRKMRL